ncbi:hypothetical protein SFRURICE_004241 [Spodoptera frugiperda]|nr:hypothetical protein SFRURICE_004241 [Spodoptera frugiperda]
MGLAIFGSNRYLYDVIVIVSQNGKIKLPREDRQPRGRIRDPSCLHVSNIYDLCLALLTINSQYLAKGVPRDHRPLSMEVQGRTGFQYRIMEMK